MAATVPQAGFCADCQRVRAGAYALSLAAAMAFIWFLVRHIAIPWGGWKNLPEAFPGGSTGAGGPNRDELETVAESMNRMSRDIQEYQRRLLDKNREMEELLDNVAPI